MFRYRVFLLALACTAACIAACNNSVAGENNRDAAAERETAAAPAKEPAGSAASIYKQGQTLKVLKDRAPCRETGPNAGEPWEVKKDSFVNFVRVEGSEVRVESAPGLQCLIDSEALGPA